MFDITTEASFSSAHSLKDYNGPCENLHGHNWLVRATVSSEILNSIGIGIDFKELKRILKLVIDELDHKNLSEIFWPLGINPSSENIAKYIYEKMKALLPPDPCCMHSVTVFETPGNCTSYYE